MGLPYDFLNINLGHVLGCLHDHPALIYGLRKAKQRWEALLNSTLRTRFFV